MSISRNHIPFDADRVRILRRLVAQGEGLHLEFKRKATYPEKIVREMIAFANTAGGTLLVGVDDDGSIPGIKYPEEESHVIQAALRKCKPFLGIKEEFIPIGNGKTIIEYTIAESNQKPHFLQQADTRLSFVRVNDQSIRASREVREIFRRRSRYKRGILLSYGPFEQVVLRHIDKQESVTLKEVIEISGVKRFVASNKIVRLVLANVLRVCPNEKGDLYYAVPAVQ